MNTLTYPVSTQGFALQLQYGYSNGQLQSIVDVADSPNVPVWNANAANPAGQITQETLGNGVVTNRVFDPLMFRLTNVTAGPGNAAIENQTYSYDAVGNLTQRQENNLGITENFHYDNADRLYYSQLTTQQYGTVTNLQLCYDNTGGSCAENLPGPGNITSKSADGAVPSSYTVSWTSYNYPSAIVTPSESTYFSYGPDRRRWQQVYNGTEITNYIGDQLEMVITGSGSSVDYRYYIYAGSHPVAIYSRNSSLVNTWNYFFTDHEGSVAAVVNSAGTVDVNEGFSAYGARRDPSSWSGVPSAADLNTIAGISRQGYTFQTALGQSMGLNHLNGRVVDAVMGRFLSPDPNIPHPGIPQSYNRYSYVSNNPVSFIDPSGFADAPFLTGSNDGLNENGNGDSSLPEITIYGGNDSSGFQANNFISSLQSQYPNPYPLLEEIVVHPKNTIEATPITLQYTGTVVWLSPTEAQSPKCVGSPFNSFLANNYGPASDVGSQYNVDPSLLLGLAAAESGYGTSPMATTQNNPFGATPGGFSTPGITYNSYGSAWQNWGNQWGARVNNVGGNVSQFINTLALDNQGVVGGSDTRGPYNTQNAATGGNPNWANLVTGAISGVQRRLPVWQKSGC